MADVRKAGDSTERPPHLGGEVRASGATATDLRPAVLLLITRLNIGGPAGQALLLAKGLEPAFHTLVAAGAPGAREGELTDPEVPVQRVPLVRPISPVTDLRSLRAVRQLVKDNRPQVVHTHMAKAGSIGRLAVLSSRPDNRPRLVHTFHGHVLEGYFGAPSKEPSSNSNGAWPDGRTSWSP